MKRNLSGFLLTAVSSLLLYSSCGKIDTTTLGTNIIPVVDNIRTFQTILNVESDNVLMNDTTRMFSQDYGVGIIANDPEFGKTTAAMYFTLEAGLRVDYVTIADAESLEPVNNWDGQQPVAVLIAAFLGEVRLIDNLLLTR